MILIVILLSSLISPGHIYAAETPDSKPLPEDTYLIPFSEELTAGWVLDKIPKNDCRLVLDIKAAPWLVCQKRFLLAPYYERMFSPNKPINNVVWLNNGLLFASSRGELAVIPVVQELKRKPAQSIEPVKLKFLGMVKLEGMKLAPAGDSSVYVYGRDVETGLTKIFLVSSGNKWNTTLLTATKKNVTAVAGDGNSTFVTTGRQIIKLIAGRNNEKPQTVLMFEHPYSAFTGIDYSPKLGLFYATDKGAGFIGENYYFEFLSSPQTQIQLKGNSLFVMLSKERGVLRIDGMNVFNKTDSELMTTESSKPLEKTKEALNMEKAGKEAKP